MASILVLEDDAHFRDTIVELLTDQRHQVHQASTFEEALAAARRHSIHLLLTDVRIAGVQDGVNALEAIQKLQPGARSIVMTGYADPEAPLRAARLQADDYLHKPFRLKALLQAVQAVLERETPFRNLFQRLAGAPAQAAQRALSWAFDGQLQQLNQIREGVLQQIYLLLRSHSLNRDEAHALFCRWEALELEYWRNTNPQLWGRLALAYAELAFHELHPVGSETLTEALFHSLHARILTGQVEVVHLQKAIPLLHFADFRKQNLEAYTTYHWLWGSPQAEDPFLGLNIGNYRLARCRSGLEQTVRLYEACHETRNRHGDTVLCVPCQPDTEPLVERELRSGRASLLKTQLGHHFLLYKGDSLSLRMNLPPEGAQPGRAWELLRPVFEQVVGYHRQQRYSGSFSLRDIEAFPDQPCRLTEFSDHSYREQHASLQRPGCLVMNWMAAPEVYERSAPDAASDQAVLGRLLLETVLGGVYPDPASRIYLRFLGTPEADAHFRQYIPRLGPLARPFYRLCQADPQRRYADLSEAIGALDQALA